MHEIHQLVAVPRPRGERHDLLRKLLFERQQHSAFQGRIAEQLQASAIGIPVAVGSAVAVEEEAPRFVGRLAQQRLLLRLALLGQRHLDQAALIGFGFGDEVAASAVAAQAADGGAFHRQRHRLPLTRAGAPEDEAVGAFFAGTDEQPRDAGGRGVVALHLPRRRSRHLGAPAGEHVDAIQGGVITAEVAAAVGAGGCRAHRH